MTSVPFSFRSTFLRSFSFWWYFLRRLPSLAFWGARVTVLSAKECSISLPFSWWTKNPFGSIYFGALAGAAELATGVLLRFHLEDKGSVSMLVTSFRMDFLKKATNECVFCCVEGDEIAESIHHMTTSGQMATIILKATGYNRTGDPVAVAYVTWSLRRR